MARTKLRSTISAVCPSRSYMARKNIGSISAIINNTATLLPSAILDIKYVGTPTAAADEKHISWRLVRLNATLVFTFERSFGTGTYAIYSEKN